MKGMIRIWNDGGLWKTGVGLIRRSFLGSILLILSGYLGFQIKSFCVSVRLGTDSSVGELSPERYI